MMLTSSTRRKLPILLSSRSNNLPWPVLSATDTIIGEILNKHDHQYQFTRPWSTSNTPKPSIKTKPQLGASSARKAKPFKQTKPRAAAKPASSGRIAYHDLKHRRERRTANALLCSGCGVEILTGNSRIRNNTRDDDDDDDAPLSERMKSGPGALQPRSKRLERKARYADAAQYPFDRKRQAPSAPLCERCEQLRSGNVRNAYDALKDVDPSVFADQLSHIVGRRKFGLCIVVADATDPEFSSVKRLRDVIGSTPCILALNKIDLLPRCNGRDVGYLQAQIQKGRDAPRMIGAYGVSALRGRGLVSLAEGVLDKIAWRDVFVVGSANVGKSTLVKNLSSLLARSLRLKGKNFGKRRDILTNLNVTSSHLPGTTLQAVRIPCFPSSHHALWDTPGIINRGSLAYSLFPSHLMEPLAFPTRVEIPSTESGTKLRVERGQSILIEAGWVGGGNDEEGGSRDDATFTLARLDVTEDYGMPIDALVFIPSSLKVRLVPTAKAPTEATMPKEYSTKVEQLVGNKGIFHATHFSKPLAIYKGDGSGVSKDGHVSFDVREDAQPNGWINQDIVFASLGFIMLTHRRSFTVRPWVVQGSKFLKRPSLYPSNLKEWNPDLDDTSNEQNSYDSKLRDDDKRFKEIKQRLRKANDKGKQHADFRGRTKFNDEDGRARYFDDKMLHPYYEDFGDDEFWRSDDDWGLN